MSTAQYSVCFQTHYDDQQGTEIYCNVGFGAFYSTLLLLRDDTNEENHIKYDNYLVWWWDQTRDDHDW